MTEEITQTQYAIFNKHNGVLFTFEEDKDIANGYNKDNFLVKEIVLRPGEYYFGDYYTGKIYSEDQMPLVREDEMEENFYQDIIGTYSYIKQILIITGVLETNKDIIKTKEFNDFVNFLKMKKERYEQSLLAVKNNKDCFNFLSIEEIRKHIQKRSEGIV